MESNVSRLLSVAARVDISEVPTAPTEKTRLVHLSPVDALSFERRQETWIL